MNSFSQITPEIRDLSAMFENNSGIDPNLYDRYDVKRGLRDINGIGVLTGLTVISEIASSEVVDGKEHPCDGRLFYRGINVEEIVEGFIAEDRFGFEEVAYLLMFGKMPNAGERERFNKILANYRSLPTNFVRDIIMKAPSHDMMYTQARSGLTMYS